MAVPSGWDLWVPAATAPTSPQALPAVHRLPNHSNSTATSSHTKPHLLVLIAQPDQVRCLKVTAVVLQGGAECRLQA